MLRMYFFHDDLDEIYMNIFPRFEDTSNKVCELKKAYGLQKSPNALFRRLANVMKDSWHKQSQGDNTLLVM